MKSTLLLIPLMVLSASAFAEKGRGAGLQSFQSAFPSGTATYVYYIRYEDDAEKNHWISQVSEPDDVCHLLGLGKALYDESGWATESGHVLIDRDRLSFEKDATRKYDFLVCTVLEPKESPKVEVESKVRNSDGSVLISGVVALSLHKMNFRFSHDSDPTALCKLLGYPQGVSLETNREQTLVNEEALGVLKLSAEGKIVQFSWERAAKGWDGIKIPKNHFITDVTCRK